LLVADNHTDSWAAASPQEQRRITPYAFPSLTA
jgi:hypothetical protein